MMSGCSCLGVFNGIGVQRDIVCRMMGLADPEKCSVTGATNVM